MNRPAVILHLIASNFHGGPEKQILTHARHLDPERFRFVLVSFMEPGTPNEIMEKAAALGLETVELPVRHSFDPRCILRLARIIREEKARLVCSHGYKANIIGRLATWACRVPQVAVSRGWTAEDRRVRLYERLDKFFLRLNDHVVAVSHGQKEKILKLGVPSGILSVIHNAIMLERDGAAAAASGVRGELGIPADAVLVASAGRLSPEKNYASMVEAASLVCKERREVYFAVFGEGVLRPELEEQVRRLGLQGRFLFPGFRKDMPQVMASIDIFMLPSFTEGLPNVALEAFAARKPIVATAVGGTPEVVRHEASGFLTTPQDVAGMARHLLRLAADPALRREMGERGYRHVAEHFCFEEQTLKYSRLYDRLLAGGGR